jgi:flagellar protein FliO/FliZ
MGEIGWSEWLSMMSSLAVVLALLAVTLFGLKKMGLSSAKDLSKKLQVGEVHNLGPRQKLIVVSINNEQILLGVTPQSINRLGNWPDQKTADNLEQSVAIEQADPETATENTGRFQQLLTQIADRTTARKKL